MTAISPKAFLMSATLHGAIAAALLLFTYALNRDTVDVPKIIELVAGEGDNFGAKVAPALGVEGGVKLDVPKVPERKPAPPEPAPAVAPPPPAPTPTPKTVPPPVAPKEAPPKDFAKAIKSQVRAADNKAKRQIAQERKREEDEKKKMSKEEFDRANKSKAANPPKSGTPKVAKVDTEGIRKGVVGGSPENKVGGAGGKALKNDNDDVLAAYDALFKQRLRAAFEPPPGLSDSLKVTIEVRSHPDGTLSHARVTQSSGSPEFDRAVLDAVRRVQMPVRPDKKTETVQFDFTMRERSEG